MAIILDVECVAIDDVEVEPVSAPSNWKDEAKIAAYVAEKTAKQVSDAALYPWTARIIALGWADEGSPVVESVTANNEATEGKILREFWARVWDRATGSVVQSIVTFNGFRYDLPVLMVRSRLLGVECPDLNLDRYRSPHVDLMQVATFRGAIDMRSLKFFAKRFGLDVSDAFSGKEVAQLYQDQNWDAIKKHVESDVTLTRQLAERFGVIRQRVRV